MACAPSNIAVDNIVEKLAASKLSKVKMVRIGHPARLLQSVLNFSLDVIVYNDESSQILSDIKQDMDKILTKISKTSNRQDKYKLRGENSNSNVGRFF